MRTGIGYDIHKLVEGRKMVLGGVEIESLAGPLGHSDGDVLIHAIIDAILGALSLGDIGMRYPDTDPAYKDISSRDLLNDMKKVLEDEGASIKNIDSIIITEQPKISLYRENIIRSLSLVLGVAETIINVKGKTNEGLGDIGQGKAIAAHAVVLLDVGE